MTPLAGTFPASVTPFSQGGRRLDLEEPVPPGRYLLELAIEEEKGDFFVVPPWAWHEHAATGGEAILFSVHDTPVLAPLGLYREEAYEKDAGHQAITDTFRG